MRYSVYKYIKNLSDSICEAVEHIKLDNNIALLSDCVVAISAIKNSLVASKGPEVPELDLFLRKVEQIIEEFESSSKLAENIAELYTIAKKINDICSNNINYTFKIVFFAELGSKWDAMDSVYWAYKKREDCEVTVVLAPIFRAIKLPDGSVKSDVIYRDYLTDMGIEFVEFKQYDIKKDMPDIAFTSQPYESVTPEQFWAENIIPYTRLVYLPYFTNIGSLEDGDFNSKHMLPIHSLAWRIACQSERQKGLFMKYNPNAVDKLIVCGLPKWDWVVNMDSRDILLPEGWKKLKDKKVVLKNYHYNVANNADAFFNEVRANIEEISNTDIAFIYRFHPMMNTMFNVYFLDKKEAWEELKESIRNSPNTVLDENETYDCAFKFSDMLFSDLSSIVPQYLLTKKPVVLLYQGWLEGGKAYEVESEKWLMPFTTKLPAINAPEEFMPLCKKIFDDDFGKAERMEFIEDNYCRVDGKIGENLSQLLIDLVKKEDNV